MTVLTPVEAYVLEQRLIRESMQGGTMAKERRTVRLADGEVVPMSLDEDALEDAREKVHKRGASDADRKKYKELQAKVAAARQATRFDEGRAGVSVQATTGGEG